MHSTSAMPWIVLGVIMIAVLLYKGVLPNPFATKASQKSSADNGTNSSVMTPGISYGFGAGASTDELAKLGSHVLGIAFAKATRLEAEERIARDMAAAAGAKIEATFRNPFLPESAQADPPNAPPPKS